jgi:acyl dehydratase
MFMRMFADRVANRALSEGAPGVDEVRWLKPVLAGDTLTGRTRVIATRASKSRPEIGFVSIVSELSNQRGERVLEQSNSIMLRRRGAST